MDIAYAIILVSWGLTVGVFGVSMGFGKDTIIAVSILGGVVFEAIYSKSSKRNLNSRPQSGHK